MLSRVITFAIDGLESRRVMVEVDIRPGLPSFTIVGLADAAVREARERVRAALLNSAFEFPARRITANLAPAALRKAGPGFDLALATGLLTASGQLPSTTLQKWAFVGELSLSGDVQACRGVLAVAEGARRAGLEGVVVPVAGARQAALVVGVGVVPVASLGELAAFLDGRVGAAAIEPGPADGDPPTATVDLAEVRGQRAAVRAIEVAAAGGHNLLMQGPPGSGKTMLARRLPTILPELAGDEALEVTRIQSVAGLHGDGGLVRARPFRAPHHTVSAAGLIGGGSIPTPGEVTLAHGGVLFLDELSEFTRPALEALRQPLEDGFVSVVRGQRSARFPARCMLVAATNPCPCGFLGERDRCRCSEPDIARHRRRLSGPLLDRIDLVVPVERPATLDASHDGTSSDVRARVARARATQETRLAGTGMTCNAQMDARQTARLAGATPAARAVLLRAYERSTLSVRGHQRTLRVARTLADLDGSRPIEKRHVVAALSLRQDWTPEADAA